MAGEQATKDIGPLSTELHGRNFRGRIRTCDLPRQRRSNPCVHHQPDLISTTTPRQVAEKVSSRPAISPSAKTAADFAVLTARLKPRPFKTRSRPKFFRGPLFPLPLKACPDTSNGFSHGPNTAVFVLAGELSKRVRGRSFLVPWGCAPVPETQRLGRVRNSAWSFFAKSLPSFTTGETLHACKRTSASAAVRLSPHRRLFISIAGEGAAPHILYGQGTAGHGRACAQRTRTSQLTYVSCSPKKYP